MLKKYGHYLTLNGPRVLAVLLFIGYFHVGHAAATFQQAPISNGNGFFANASAGAVMADNFSVAGPISLQTLSWWGSYDGTDTDHFVVKIYSNTNGSPGTVLNSYNNISVTKTSAGITDNASAPVYRYDFNLPQTVLLTAGNYFLSVTNETTQYSWFWLTGSGGDNQYKALAANGINWDSPTGSDMAFAVTTPVATPVPIPFGYVLIMMGVLAVIGTRIQNSRRSQAG